MNNCTNCFYYQGDGFDGHCKRHAPVVQQFIQVVTTHDQMYGDSPYKDKPLWPRIISPQQEWCGEHTIPYEEVKNENL